jgi:hypothetical protein
VHQVGYLTEINTRCTVNKTLKNYFLIYFFDGENISFDTSLAICINSTNIPPIMIINRIHENQNLLLL